MIRNTVKKVQRALRRRTASPRQWADYLRELGTIYHIGEDCSILPATKFGDPHLTWIGDRVCLGACTLLGHDGAIETLNRLYNLKLDRVGPVIIEDDVFVGEGAIILSNVTVGKGSIVGAGAVVRQSVPPGSVVMGNPAKVVAKTEVVARFWEADTLALPWADLIAQRQGAFDPTLEPELNRRRVEHFFQGPLKRR
jgi:acetyltransferase-like isoleucine patch superfamily enzyme